MLLIAWSCTALLVALPAATLYLLSDLALFQSIVRSNLELPIQWHTVAHWQWYSEWALSALLLQALATPVHFAVSSILLPLNRPAGQKMLSVTFGSNEFRAIGVSLILWVMSNLLITEQNLSLLRTGKVKGVRFSTLEKICETLQCQPGDILSFSSAESHL